MKLFCLTLLFAALAPAQPRPAPAASPEFTAAAGRAAAAREAGRLADALTEYRRAVRLKPSWTEGWWYLGTLCYDQERFAEARDALRRFVALDQRAGPPYALLGLSEFQTKDYESALQHLQKAQAVGLAGNQSISDVTRFHTALLLNRFGQHEAAMKLLMHFAQNGQETPVLIEAAGLAGLRLPLLPGEPPVADRPLILLAGRGLVAAAQRHAPEAQKVLEELVASYGDQPNVHYLFGSFLMFSEPDKGIEELQQELKISPRHVPARIGLAFEYMKRGEAQKAIPYAQEAARIDPESFVTRTTLGRVYTDVGELDKAIAELKAAVKLAPDSPQTRFALSAAYSKAGRKEEAAREKQAFLGLKRSQGDTGVR